jgi:Spy/CpxP family protein refolding chaperone
MRKRDVLLSATLLIATAMFLSSPSRGDPTATPEEAKVPDGYHPAIPKTGWRETLSEEQKAEIDFAHLRLRQKQALLEAQIGLKRAEIDRLIASEDGDQGSLQNKIDELAALEKERLMNRYMHIMEVRQILTPKQRVGFDLDMLSRHRED